MAKFGILPNTKVWTPKGRKPICTMTNEDEIFDTNGWKWSINRISMLYPNDYLIGIKANGSELICSRNQRIFTDDGLKFADTIERGTMVLMDDIHYYPVESIEIRYYVPEPMLMRIRTSQRRIIIANCFAIEC